jgi:tetratricopeptide (TPR) repeat protein
VRRLQPKLEAALRREPDDLTAAEARAQALALQNHPAEALTVFEAVLAREPEREVSLVGAAATAEAAGRPELALSYKRRAISANPWLPEYRRQLVLLLIKEDAWAEALPHCDDWVRLDPFSTEARAARITCLLGLGIKDKARAEFARIEALAPDDLRELQARFGKKLK